MSQYTTDSKISTSDALKISNDNENKSAEVNAAATSKQMNGPDTVALSHTENVN